MNKKSENLYLMLDKSVGWIEVDIDNVVEAIAELIEENFTYEELSRVTQERGDKTVHEIFIEKYQQLTKD